MPGVHCYAPTAFNISWQFYPAVRIVELILFRYTYTTFIVCMVCRVRVRFLVCIVCIVCVARVRFLAFLFYRSRPAKDTRYSPSCNSSRL